MRSTESQKTEENINSLKGMIEKVQMQNRENKIRPKENTAKQEHKQVQSNSKTEAAGRTNTPNKPLNRTANGQSVPYLGNIEARVSVPFLKDNSFDLPILVVPNTSNNSNIPVIIGTNFFRLCRLETSNEAIPEEWDKAFRSLVNDSVGIVKSTQRINLKPFETRTVTGFVRKSSPIESVVTEPCDDQHCSSRVDACPRVVTLNKPGNSARVPVRIFNLSAKAISLPPKSNLCQLQEVKVLRSAPMFDEENQDKTATVNQQNIDDTNQEKEDITKRFSISLDNSMLKEEQKAKVKNMFNKWEHIFSTGATDLGETDFLEHEIHLTDYTPFKQPYRNIAPGLMQEIKEHIHEMLACGAIRQSNSPFSSNVVIVLKKDGQIRFCIDFRTINNRTIKDTYAIPRIENILHLLSGSKYFSKLDLKAGYWYQ
ncbi:uncharacterized protein LOC128559152 [Mercenaria mercenaria]|uniref:uncharacterized protein LOC128559152 n=1 Tax=Mercenaria mercenaria TaxID=6596 RepID=UPI00234F46B4|nr:uncharacterized protein LOC128559152 [Mercenaria mercenaria]